MDLLAMSFRGRQAWLTWTSYLLGVSTFFAGLYFLSRFFATDDLKTSLAWALAIIACMIVFATIKVFGWQQLHKLELMREIKRLELRTSLASKDQPS